MSEVDLNQLLDEMLEMGLLDIIGSELSPPTAEREEDVAQLVSRNPMPDDLKTLLARAHGAYVGSINLFTLDELEDVNNLQDFLFTYIPSAVFFASDGGDGFFFVDTDDSLGCGEGAVFWVYRGGVRPNRCVFCGRDLIEFLTSFLDEEEVWKNPSLEEQAIGKMLVALDAKQDQWIGSAGARLMDVIGISDRYNLRAPKVLDKLLRKSNGIVFTAANSTLWSTEMIKPVESAFSTGDRPLALLIGEDKAGNQYAITHYTDPSEVPQGWPYLEGRVARLTPGRPLEEAQSLGYLPDVVLEWLGVTE
jgi:hypothetical protein